jgi:hypothetical protein
VNGEAQEVLTIASHSPVLVRLLWCRACASGRSRASSQRCAARARLSQPRVHRRDLPIRARDERRPAGRRVALENRDLGFTSDADGHKAGRNATGTCSTAARGRHRLGQPRAVARHPPRQTSGVLGLGQASGATAAPVRPWSGRRCYHDRAGLGTTLPREGPVVHSW